MINKQELEIFSIASCISADANITNEDRKKNIELLKKIKEICSDNLKNSCDKGISILEKEIEENKE